MMIFKTQTKLTALAYALGVVLPVSLAASVHVIPAEAYVLTLVLLPIAFLVVELTVALLRVYGIPYDDT